MQDAKRVSGSNLFRRWGRGWRGCVSTHFDGGLHIKGERGCPLGGAGAAQKGVQFGYVLQLCVAIQQQRRVIRACPPLQRRHFKGLQGSCFTLRDISSKNRLLPSLLSYKKDVRFG